MNPCEKILRDMRPAIQSYHRGKWMYQDDRPQTAEELYKKYLARLDTVTVTGIALTFSWVTINLMGIRILELSI